MEEYLNYCDLESKDTQFAIKTGERQIEDISAISSTIASKEQELAEAEGVRKAEHADFAAV